jgi:hypothetical protein
MEFLSLNAYTDIPASISFTRSLPISISFKAGGIGVTGISILLANRWLDDVDDLSKQ